MANELISIIRRVIDAVDGDLPVQNITDARELLEHDEWGEALSLICTQLYEYDVKVTQATFDQIKLAAEKMRLDSKGWEVIEIQNWE